MSAARRLCARCGREAGIGRHWPDGPVCWNCYATAMETRADCARCGQHRLTPGLDRERRPLCLPCSGIKAGFTCARCGREAPRYQRGTCGNCVLADRLAALLDDGTGRILPELVPFHDHVSRMPRPRTGLLWISKPHVPPVLAALARGRVPLTHEGLSALSPRKSAVHVRDLLVAAGVLPEEDRFLLLFEQWLAVFLAGTADQAQRRLLHRFATWHTLRRLRAAAGIPNITGRTAALRHLLLQAPPPVVAAMLGYSTATTEHLATAAGNTWKNYAPGDHRR